MSTAGQLLAPARFDQLRYRLAGHPEIGAGLIILAAWLALLVAGRRPPVGGEPSAMAGMPAKGGPVAGLGGIVLMSVAMMGPAALAGIRHTAINSLRWRRRRAMSEFAAGYLTIWVGFGMLVEAGRRLGRPVPADRSGTIDLVVLLAAADGWQRTRFKRRWLRDCHRSRPLPPRGWRAERAAVHFGARLGLACLGSCWCLMLIPMLAPSGQLLWAIGLSAVITTERLRQQPRRLTRLTGDLLAVGALWAAVLAIA